MQEGCAKVFYLFRVPLWGKFDVSVSDQIMDGDAASIQNDPPEEQIEDENAPPVLKLRTDIFQKGVVNGAAPIKLCRNFTTPTATHPNHRFFATLSLNFKRTFRYHLYDDITENLHKISHAQNLP